LSARDLVTALVLSWILAICTGYKIAGYLGYITGAFDRVFKDYLLAKLQAAGIGSTYLNFLDSYLQPRIAQVVVEGVASEEFTIENQVFQGTILGPPLWNTFFSDVVHSAASTGGEPSMFADDLSVFQKFDKSESNEELSRVMHVCRAGVHKWGKVNRVAFDPGKEHVVVIHPISGFGDPFKFLGCLFDCKLIMDHAIDKILTQARPKITAILRTRSHYSKKDLISQFKTHIWGIMETQNGAIFHSAEYLLEKLDSAQRRFLHELDLDEATAFMEFNFAPPSLRRDIGILGLLQKRVLGKAHPVFQKLLPFYADVFGNLRPGDHDRQLYGHNLDIKFQCVLYSRSIFGMVHVYNHLPQNVVNEKTVSGFQKLLTLTARQICQEGIQDWKKCFSCH